ncbi:variable surface lipoprotein [Mycoplasma phocoeninasale]|uniref:variable surface lipoprotein n=1 Tax=Mycoplasma phocoeninasale TaxID=2726117 RepID=UPI001967C973|nr:variable surface lipoprotein [Mycoplasma phocoeninasale]MBN0970873.1 variable surface lipoprotein [Mycoplasma phocoeninasale]
MKKSTKLMISLGSIASVISLPLIAASCGGTKKENPKPDNPELKEVQDSLNNVTVDVTNKNKLASTVQKNEVTIAGKIVGFTFTVESITANDTAGELTVVVKSTKGQTSATKTLTINGFKKQNNQNGGGNQGDDGQKPSPTPETEQEKLAKKITFDYKGTINDTVANFDTTKIILGKNDGFDIEKSQIVVKKKIGPALSIFPSNETFAIVKLVLKKENKMFDFYVKFQTKKDNPVGIQVLKSEFDSGEEIQKQNQEENMLSKQEFEKNAKFTYNNLSNMFNKSNVKLTGVSGYDFDVINSLTSLDSVGELRHHIAKIAIKRNNKTLFEVFVKFIFTGNIFTNDKEYNDLLNKNAEEKLRTQITFTYAGPINKMGTDFQIGKITLANNEDFKIDPNVAPVIKINVIVKLVLKNATKSHDFYVKFEAEKANAVVGNKDNIKAEFDKIVADELKAAEEKLRAQITFTYAGPINKMGTDFQIGKITLANNEDFKIDPNVAPVIKIKTEGQPAKTYVIVKLVLKNATKSHDFYVKFEAEKANAVVGNKDNIKAEFDKIS